MIRTGVRLSLRTSFKVRILLLRSIVPRVTRGTIEEISIQAAVTKLINKSTRFLRNIKPWSLTGTGRAGLKKQSYCQISWPSTEVDFYRTTFCCCFLLLKWMKNPQISGHPEYISGASMNLR